MTIRSIIGAMSTCILVVSINVQAAPVFYTDEAAFTAAASGASIALSMESFENSSNGGLNGFSGINISGFYVLYCNPGNVYNPGPCPSTDANKSVEWEREITITFDNPINAFGIDIINIGTSGPITLTLTSDNGSQILYSGYEGINGNVIFSGLIDTDAQFSSITFRNFVYGTEVLDGNDIVWADRMHTGVIPLPPAVWLFGSGLIGLIGIARRKV